MYIAMELFTIYGFIFLRIFIRTCINFIAAYHPVLIYILHICILHHRM